ncbi:MAG: hypothetical protein AB1896_11145 [Thermodesulfobacteriota bacterium]
MGLSAGLILLGLAGAGYGLTGRSTWRRLVAPPGWVLFLAGLLKALAPGFFD